MNLCEKPQIDPETYWSRKRYSINVQIICNERRETIYYQVGYPGSCPDTVCFRTCDIFRNPQRYLSNGEYILADGGYLLNNRTLIPYRNPQEFEKQVFNQKISSARNIVEHGMGIIKDGTRFGWRLGSANFLRSSCKWSGILLVLLFKYGNLNIAPQVRTCLIWWFRCRQVSREPKACY